MIVLVQSFSEAIDAFVHGTVLASFCECRLSSSVSRLSKRWTLLVAILKGSINFNRASSVEEDPVRVSV